MFEYPWYHSVILSESLVGYSSNADGYPWLLHQGPVMHGSLDKGIFTAELLIKEGSAPATKSEEIIFDREEMWKAWGAKLLVDLVSCLEWKWMKCLAQMNSIGEHALQ